MGGLSSIQFFLDFWNLFNFAKPLSKDAGVQRHNMILVAQLFLLLQTRRDASMAACLLTLQKPESQQAWWSKGHCQLERSPTFFSASVLPLAMQMQQDMSWPLCWKWRQSSIVCAAQVSKVVQRVRNWPK